MLYLRSFILFLAIHNSGIITGAFMNNGAVKCGNLICRPVSGIFTKNPLPNGYIHVATIPKAASNISITELKNSMNLLVLKYADHKYIINGDYTTSSSGIYNAAGAVFDYRRIDMPTKNTTANGYRKFEGVTEWITSTGPITEPVHLMLFKVLVQEVNVGIKYEYLLPITSNESDEFSQEVTSSETEQPNHTTIMPDTTVKHTLKSGATHMVSAIGDDSEKATEKRRRRFFWKVVGFTQCNKSCGGGTQSPVIRCVRENPMRYFKPKRCSHLTKPLINENLIRCNTQPCPAYWKISDWGACQCTSDKQENFKKREIKCVQELGTGMVIQVPFVACSEEKPRSTEQCDCPRSENSYQPHFEKDNQNTVTNSIKNRPYIRRTSTIYGNNTISKRAHPSDNKNTGVWLASNWNEKCSSDCGTGVQYRSIFCDRTPPKSDRCDARSAPETTRQCSSSEVCSKANWFSGPWSKCSGDCFNLTQSRTVHCIREADVVQGSNCDGTQMPEHLRPCAMSDVTDCKPKWHYSEWSECTKPCGEGTQRRTVKCFEPLNGELKSSERCKYSKRLPASQICNVQPCHNTDDDVRNELIQNDIAPVCKDELPDCRLVAQDYLCKFAYFKENCCETCHSHFGY